MDAVPCEIENGIFCFYKMKRERPPLFFIYHNADSANNGLVVTLIINKPLFTIGHDPPKL